MIAEGPWINTRMPLPTSFENTAHERREVRTPFRIATTRSARAAGFFTNAEPSKLPPDMKAGLTGVKPMLVSLGVLLLGFLFLLPERCTVNMAFLRQDTPAPAKLRERIKLPPGFSIAVYASDLPGVRVLRFTEAGDLLASLPEAGSIVLFERDRNGDGGPDGRRELLGGLERPHGIDIFEDSLTSRRPMPSAACPLRCQDRPDRRPVSAHRSGPTGGGQSLELAACASVPMGSCT